MCLSNDMRNRCCGEKQKKERKESKPKKMRTEMKEKHVKQFVGRGDCFTFERIYYVFATACQNIGCFTFRSSAILVNKKKIGISYPREQTDV